MTILVLGDSFADRMGRNYPWCDILSEILEEDVDNYGLGGSAIEYSYDAFLKHYEPKKYSRVIFIMTDEQRQFYINLNNDRSEFFNFHLDRKNTLNGLKHLNKLSEKWTKIENITAVHKKILQGQEMINAYYKDSYSWKPTAIEDSVRLRVKEPLLILNIEHLVNIQMLDYNNLNIEWDTTLENKNRPNHLSIEQNKQLANYIAKYFKDDFNIYKTFKYPSIYYTISKTHEEAGLNK